MSCRKAEYTQNVAGCAALPALLAVSVRSLTYITSLHVLPFAPMQCDRLNCESKARQGLESVHSVMNLVDVIKQTNTPELDPQRAILCTLQWQWLQFTAVHW